MIISMKHTTVIFTLLNEDTGAVSPRQSIQVEPVFMKRTKRAIAALKRAVNEQLDESEKCIYIDSFAVTRSDYSVPVDVIQQYGTLMGSTDIVTYNETNVNAETNED